MSDASKAVEVYLPNPERARQQGWKYHIQWSDDGRPCFYRRKTLSEVIRDFDKLSAEGLSPFVVDAFTGEIVQVGTSHA